MAGGIDANATLGYIEFQIFPSQNRYEACVCCSDRKETVVSGSLTQLLQHSDKVKTLNSDRGKANFKLEPPENLSHAKWFTKATLLRFLHIIGSSNIVDTTNAVINEISQLEEARKFHLSLYKKGPHTHQQAGETGNSFSNGAMSMEKAEDDNASSDSSKNELLRAIDLRLTALRGELASALDKAAGATCLPEEIINLEKFSHYFGAAVLRKTLLKIMENLEILATDFSSEEQSLSRNDSGDQKAGSINKDNNASIPSNSNTPVKYGVSPAKAAQAERRSSPESEESSCSSEDDQPSVERSRTLIRSASPRRSGSPMRRVQIGRSGPRRSTPLTIKSLSHFPAREKLFFQKDAARESTDDEGSEEPSRRSDGNVKRMSVQDAISLFESKQKEQIVDIQKARSLLNASVSANKSVLRRWSSGMGESSAICPSDVASDKSVLAGDSTVEAGEVGAESQKSKEESNHLAPDNHPTELSEVNVQSSSFRESESVPVAIQEDASPPVTAEVSEKISASAEWSRQKEEELNQLLMKMMETKPDKNRGTVPDVSKSLNMPTGRRGSFYDHYKEKREEKLRGEMNGKRAEKIKHVRAMQQIIDESKAAIASKVSNDIGGRQNVKKPQKPLKSGSQSATTKKVTPTSTLKKETRSANSKKETQSANSKKEITKPAAVTRSSQKASSLPITRKSWPSAPSPRGMGASAAATSGGTTATGSTTSRRQSQPALSAPRSSPKVEGSQLRSKPLKASADDVSKSTKSINQKKQQTVARTEKTKKSKVQTDSAGAASSEKPGLQGKVTKKSSVVPLESKPFLRKGSGLSPTVKPKSLPPPEESLRKSRDLTPARENETVPDSSGDFIEKMDVEVVKIHDDTSVSTEVDIPQVCEDTVIPAEVVPNNGDGFPKMEDSLSKSEAEEEMLISPSAWVEIEEQDHQAGLSNDSIPQAESPTNFAPVKIPSPRVRHSLSQMLLEETSEPEVIEWGNAEEPPSMIYQKDAAKGLKRLLKFARKSKTDGNSTGWSSPPVFSEGEDDGEESKALHKKSSENLLKKATLRAQNDGHQKNSSFETYEDNPAHELSAQANTSKFSTQALSSRTTTKASRSFFSLSAFKGGKQSEAKFR